MKTRLSAYLLVSLLPFAANSSQAASGKPVTVSVVNIFAQNTAEEEPAEIIEEAIKQNINFSAYYDTTDDSDEEAVETAPQADIPSEEGGEIATHVETDTATDSVVEETPTSNTPEVPVAPVAPSASTVIATGTAQHDVFRNQMNTIRDRALNIGRQRSERPVEDRKYWVQTQKGGKGGSYVSSSRDVATDLRYNFWIEGSGLHSHLNAQGNQAGYKLSAWGGTVGADASIDRNTSVGLAFTASYGNLSSQAENERATGDLDNLFLNLFGHYQDEAWRHTLVLSGATTDASLNRSVNGITTQGDTDGYGLGALYELSYDIALNDNGTSLLQPLFDASIQTTRLDADSESGALHVDKQEWTTATLALGARWSGMFGAETLGQTFFGELRATVSQDFGDTQGKATISNGALSDTIHGSKQGSTAVQIGAAISTAIGAKGTLYATTSADLRSREYSVNGSIGYRYSF